MPRAGPQRTNDDVTFSGETAILAQVARRRHSSMPTGCWHASRPAGSISCDHECARRAPADPLLHAARTGVGWERFSTACSRWDRQGLLHYDLKPGKYPLRPGRATDLIDFEFARFEPCLDAYAPDDSGLLRGLQRFAQSPLLLLASNVANFEFRTLCRYVAGLASKRRSATDADDILPRLSAGEVAISHAEWRATSGALAPNSVEQMSARAGIAREEVRSRARQGRRLRRTARRAYAMTHLNR